MAQPTPYDRQASFSNIQAQAPDDPLPGDTLDAELNAVKATLDEVLTNLALIQRDDGALANESVGLDQLSEEIEVGWQAPEPWVTGTAYVSGDTVFHGSAFYRLLTAHTAGTFATDLAAGKWELIVDLSDVTIVAASQIANTPSGSIAATTVQAAIDELASEKAASSHTHPSSAITDSTAAGRSMLSAANAAAQRTLLGLGDLALEDTVPVTDIDAQLALTGIIEPSALASDQNDWAPTGVATCSTIRMSASAVGVDLTGLLAPATDGEIKILENVGTTYSITLSPSSASSAAANRFLIQKPIVVGPNQSVALRYDLGDARWRLFDRSGNFGRGYRYGLTLSNNGSDATNDIDIAAGEARGARNLLDLVLTTGLTKRLDADWSAGTGNGMRETTAIANGTYHIFLIGKADGTTDVFAYTGVDPTSVLPTGYIDYRRIGSILRESAAIASFVQYGDRFVRKTPVKDANVSPTATEASVTLSVPTGVRVEAKVNGWYAGADNVVLFLYPPDISAPSVTANDGPASVGGSISGSGVATVGSAIPEQNVLTNTSAQIKHKSSSSSGSMQLWTLGWRDFFAD